MRYLALRWFLRAEKRVYAGTDIYGSFSIEPVNDKLLV